MEEVLSDPPPAPKGLQVTPEQLLEDLETLEWIAIGRPTHGDRLLRDMFARYAGAPGPASGQRPTLWYRMRERVRQVWTHRETPLV
jgi:hypothetical protein